MPFSSLNERMLKPRSSLLNSAGTSVSLFNHILALPLCFTPITSLSAAPCYELTRLYRETSGYSGIKTILGKNIPSPPAVLSLNDDFYASNLQRSHSGCCLSAEKKKNSRQLSAGSPPHMLSQRRLTKCNQQTQSKRLRELKSVLKQQKSDFFLSINLRCTCGVFLEFGT